MSETRQLVERLRVSECDSDLKTCRENWPAYPDSWCSGCLELAAADQIEADAERIKTLEHALREFIEDMEARWDMNDRSTNPGIKHCVEQGKKALGLGDDH